MKNFFGHWFLKIHPRSYQVKLQLLDPVSIELKMVLNVQWEKEMGIWSLIVILNQIVWVNGSKVNGLTLIFIEWIKSKICWRFNCKFWIRTNLAIRTSIKFSLDYPNDLCNHSSTLCLEPYQSLPKAFPCAVSLITTCFEPISNAESLGTSPSPITSPFPFNAL